MTSLNEVANRFSRTTGHRLSALRQIAEAANSEHTLLWLFDKSWGSLRLLPSYYFGKAAEAPERLRDKGIDIDADTYKALVDSNIPEELELEIRIEIEEAGLSPDAFELAVLRVPDSPWRADQSSHLQSVLGVLACSSGKSKCPLSELLHNLDHLAQQIEISRLQRFHHAVKITQSLLSVVERDIDSSLKNIGHMVKSEISARRFIYQNINTDPNWMEVDNIEGKLTTLRQSIEFRGDSDPSKFGQIQKKMAILTSEQYETEEVELLIVPFLQPSYELVGTAFTVSSDFLEALESSNSNDINLIFLAKDAPGYLQKCFSDTDILVAESVFGYIEKYASAKIFEENSSRVLRYLKSGIGGSVELGETFEALRSLSVRFTSLTCLTIHNVQSSIEIVEEGVGTDGQLEADYITRIKDSYLSKFFSSESALEVTDFFLGIDDDDGRGFKLEVHFPSSSGTSRIFVVRYTSAQISESILKSFVNLFSEVFARTRKQEHQIDRAAYLMQVRHAVIHHFAAANRSIRSIRPLWNRGMKSKDYWLSLLSDPVIEGEIDRAITSLGQASLIIENGRFLLGEIDPKSLNRKPYKFVDVVNDCIQVLQDIRDEKHIRIVSKITGSPPRVMNADEPLLHIAIMNLFDNAIKYSPYHMPIIWTIDYRQDHFRFEISSVGDRLDPTKRELLFQVGFRGSQRDRLNQRHGTGLGLPVAYKVLKAHSPMARLDFRPEPNNSDLGAEGNTFFFEMPYLTGQASAKDED